MTYDQAMKLAVPTLAVLRPFCQRISVAGSLRRHKLDGIKDVEIVAIPSNAYLAGLAALVNHQWGPPEVGKFPSKYTRIRTPTAKLDLFWATRETWGLNFFIRTGPAEYSKRALARWKEVSKGGYSEHARLCYPDGFRLETPEEMDVFRALNWPWCEPEDRK